MKFKYTGITQNQNVISGVVEAPSEDDAYEKLRQQKVRPYRVVQEKVLQTGGAFALFKVFSKPIDLKGLVVFTRQFSSLIDSGVPVVQCLDILWQQEKKKAFKNILGEVKRSIESGQGLADSLARYPEAFSDLFIRIVEAGEVSGTLDASLRRVGIQLEKLGRIRAKVIGAMVYPCITVVVAVVVLLFLLVKVIPEITKMYTENNAKLPDITVKVLAVSEWMQRNYVNLIILGLVSAIALPVLYQLESVRKIWDPFVLKLPGFGNLVKKSSIGRFTRTFSTLVSSGVPLLNAFEICERLIGNLAIKNVIRKTMQAVTEGKSMAQGLASNDLFPPMVIHMVSIGEMTGRLDELLGKVSDIYDEELDDAVNTVTGLIQPMLIVGVGGIIAFLMLAMYLPIFQLADKLSG